MVHCDSLTGPWSAGVQVVTRTSAADTVSAVVGPAVLAVAALNLKHITYMQTANALFGYYLCEKLEVSSLA